MSEVTEKQWQQGAALALRLVLVDPEATLSDESRLTIKAIVDDTPAGTYDDLDPALVRVKELVEAIEALHNLDVNGLLKLLGE